MKTIALITGLFLSVSVMGQKPLTPEQVKELNYQELTEIVHNENDTVQYDSYPMYPGGDTGLKRTIAVNIQYPMQAMEQGIQGKVLLNVTIDTLGRVQGIEFVQHAHPLLEQEAAVVMLSLQQWVPAYRNGEPATFKFTIPINFFMQTEEGNPRKSRRKKKERS